MPLKWIGLLMLAAAGLFAGNIYACAGRQELSKLRAFFRALSFMETQIEALRTPLHELIETLSREDGLFRETNEALRRGQTLAAALECLYAQFADGQAKTLARSLFASLCGCGEEQAVSCLRAAQAELAQIIRRRAGSVQEKTPLARRLALAAALTLAILLL